MKKSRFTESQLITILNKQEQGFKVSRICREHGISETTFYNWKAKYGGMNVSELTRLKELEAENARLKRMYTDLRLVHQAFEKALYQFLRTHLHYGPLQLKKKILRKRSAKSDQN